MSDDKLADLRSLLYRRRRELGWSRERVAQAAARHGAALDEEGVRYLEVAQRRVPDFCRLRAVSLALRLTWDEVAHAMGLERW